MTWCGRFSIPLGLVALSRLGRDLGLPLDARPLAYATSVGAPELPVRGDGLGETAPANLYHFVGYPSLAVVQAGARIENQDLTPICARAGEPTSIPNASAASSVK